MDVLVALTHAQPLQVQQERHHVIDRLQAGGVARVDGVHQQQRLVLYADLVEEGLLDLNHCVSHGGEFGALQELEDRAFGHDTHPVSGQHGVAYGSEQLHQALVSVSVAVSSRQTEDLGDLRNRRDICMV